MEGREKWLKARGSSRWFLLRVGEFRRSGGRAREVVEGQRSSRVESGREWSTWRAAEPEEARERRDSAGCAEDSRVRTGSAGEGSPATKGKSRLPFFSFFGVCVNVCGRRLSVK